MCNFVCLFLSSDLAKNRDPQPRAKRCLAAGNVFLDEKRIPWANDHPGLHFGKQSWRSGEFGERREGFIGS